MNKKIIELTSSEIKVIFGGADMNLFVKTGFVTSKKMSMLYCVGKELKIGIQNFDVYSMTSLAICIGGTTLIREAFFRRVDKAIKNE